MPLPPLPSTHLTDRPTDRQNGVCPLVMLTNPEKDAYVLMDMNEIFVTRRVRVMGHPAVLPTIDATMGMRAFTVKAGGFLELQHVRVRQSMGMYRDRYNGMEGAGEGLAATQVLEIKGGGVMLEPGAEGANFVGVVFLMLVRGVAWRGMTRTRQDMHKRTNEPPALFSLLPPLVFSSSLCR